VELDDVHRRHGEAGAVDHAADVAVEADVVEVELGRGDLAVGGKKVEGPGGGKKNAFELVFFSFRGKRRPLSFFSSLSSLSLSLFSLSSLSPVTLPPKKPRSQIN